MKRLIFFAAVISGCTTECDCTYYSAEKVNNGDWVVTYESDWDASCKSKDFGTDKYYSGGNTYYTKTYVICD